MRARALVTCALILSLLGLFAQFVPITPQILHTTVTTTSTATILHTVSDNPRDSLHPECGDIDSVFYKNLGDSDVEIRVMLSRPSGSCHMLVSFSTDPRVPSWQRGWEWGIWQRGNYCDLWHQSTDPKALPELVDHLGCSDNGTMVSIDVPLSAIRYPSAIYVPIVALMTEADVADFAPDPSPEALLLEVNLNTLRYSTFTSAYTVAVPLATTVPWLPLSVLAAAVSLFVGAAYISRRRISASERTFITATAKAPEESKGLQAQRQGKIDVGWIEWAGQWFTVHRHQGTGEKVKKALAIAVAVVLWITVMVYLGLFQGIILLGSGLIAICYLIYRGLAYGPVPTGKACPKCSNELQFKHDDIECPVCLTKWPVISRDSLLRDLRIRQGRGPEVKNLIKQVESTAPAKGYLVYPRTRKEELLPLWNRGQEGSRMEEVHDTRQLRREAGYDPRFLRAGWGPWTRCTRCGKEATDLYQDEPVCEQCLDRLDAESGSRQGVERSL